MVVGSPEWQVALRAAKDGCRYGAERLAAVLLVWAYRELRKGSWREPEDIVGEFVARMLREQARDLPDGDCRRTEAYLRRALRRLLVDRWREQRRWRANELLLSELSADDDSSYQPWTIAEADPLDQVLRAEERQTLQRALEHLADQNRMLIRLTLDGWTPTELAGRTRLTPNTVRQRLWSIRRQLRRLLQE
ncbi:MAG: sigma-70 family RNA polymerase sigma factor [Armatimonadota bacterium]